MSNTQARSTTLSGYLAEWTMVSRGAISGKKPKATAPSGGKGTKGNPPVSGGKKSGKGC